MPARVLPARLVHSRPSKELQSVLFAPQVHLLLVQEAQRATCATQAPMLLLTEALFVQTAALGATKVQQGALCVYCVDLVIICLMLLGALVMLAALGHLPTQIMQVYVGYAQLGATRMQLGALCVCYVGLVIICLMRLGVLVMHAA